MANPTSATHGTPEHSTRAKDPVIVKEAQKPIGFIKKVFVFLALTLLVVMAVVGIKGCSAKTAAEEPTPTTPSLTAAQVAAAIAAAQKPQDPQCTMPCTLTYYGSGKHQVMWPGVTTHVKTVVIGKGEHTFVVDGNGKFVNPGDDKLWAEKLAGGNLHFSTPDHTGVSILIAKLGG